MVTHDTGPMIMCTAALAMMHEGSTRLSLCLPMQNLEMNRRHYSFVGSFGTRAVRHNMRPKPSLLRSIATQELPAE